MKMDKQPVRFGLSDCKFTISKKLQEEVPDQVSGPHNKASQGAESSGGPETQTGDIEIVHDSTKGEGKSGESGGQVGGPDNLLTGASHLRFTNRRFGSKSHKFFLCFRGKTQGSDRGPKELGLDDGRLRLQPRHGRVLQKGAR